MTSPVAASLAAATLVTNTNRSGVANLYLDWCTSQPNPSVAAMALEGVQTTSKYPSRVITNAEERYEALINAGETGESGGGGDSTYFEDLDEAEEGQVPVYDGTLGKFKPGTVAPGGGAGPAAGALLFTADYTTGTNELTGQFPLDVDLGFTPPAGACIVVAVAIENGFGDPNISFPVMTGFGALWSRVGVGTVANFAGGRHGNFALYVGESCSGAAGHLTATQPNPTTLALRAYVFEGGTYQSGSFVLGAANYYANGTHDHSVGVTPDNDNDISVAAFLTYPKVTAVSDHHSGDTPTPWSANNNTSFGLYSSLTSPGYLRGRGGQAVAHGITCTGEQSVQGMGLVLNGI